MVHASLCVVVHVNLIVLLSVDPSDHLSHLIDGSGLSATFSGKEASEIHRENLSKLSEMSKDEILEERSKLLQTLGKC